LNFDFEIDKKVICLGDIHFVHDDKEILIIERKSLQDLVASINPLKMVVMTNNHID